MTALAVVIPTCNDTHRLRLVLEGFNRQTDQDFNLTIVSDDGPVNDEMRVVNEFGSKSGWRYVHVPNKTVPFRAAACRNRGMQFAKGDRVLFMDGDTVPTPTVVAQHKSYGGRMSVVLGRVRRIAEDDAVQAGLPDVQNGFQRFAIRDDRRLELGGVYRELQTRLEGRSRYLATPPSSYRYCWSFHMSAPLDLTRSIGGFWEKFVTHSGEDQELGLRLFKAGCNITVDFHIEAWHLDHPLRSDPNSNAHHQLIIESARLPDLLRNGGPIRPIN